MVRPGFTLVELIIVLGIIVALLAVTLPVVGAIRVAQAKRGTAALVATLADAMAKYGTGDAGLLVPASAAGAPAQMRLLWDFNGDGVIDGDPARDPAFDAEARAAAGRAGYTGPALMLGDTFKVDGEGRIVDAWRRPLRLVRHPPRTGRLQPWSLGPDGQPATTDDITPWRSARRP